MHTRRQRVKQGEPQRGETCLKGMVNDAGVRSAGGHRFRA
jgi:hypothetical protein